MREALTGEAGEVFEVMQRAADRGGQVIASAFEQWSSESDVPMRSKGAHSYNLVTQTDEASERAIVDTIRTAFPKHAILAEEEHSTTTDAEHLWVIDPLDGTNNFAHGIPHCAVSIAYRRTGRTELGVVHNPLTGDWYRAVRGRGADHNGRPLRVSAARALDEILVGVGFYYDRGEMMRSTLAAIASLFEQQIHGIRRFGTASLDLCHVAAGRFGAFFEFELAPWDFAAGALIVTEAGGVATNVHGEPLGLTGNSVLAAAPGVFPEIQNIVSAHAPTR